MTTITNSVSIGTAVYFSSGGTLTNTSTGTINVPNGLYAVQVNNGAGTVINSGSVNAKYYGIQLNDGGIVTNTGKVTVKEFDAVNASGAATVLNSGTLSSQNGVGVTLHGDDSMVSNASGGTISGGNTGIWLTGANSTVDNFGTVTGGRYSVNLAGTNDTLIMEAGSVLNGAVGGFQAGDTLDFAGLTYAAGDTVTVDGSGLLTIKDSSDHVLETLQLRGSFNYNVFGISADTSGTGTEITDTRLLISEITGTLSGVVLAAGSYTNPVTVTSTGLIGGSGVSAGTDWTIQNFGKIQGGNNGVDLQAGGVLTNEAGGTIAGSSNGVYVNFGAAATVDNFGRITGTFSYGVGLQGGGDVTNESGATIGGSNNGVYANNGAGTVDNFGSIGATNGYGVLLRQGGSVDNGAHATISGVYVGQGGTVENAGTIGVTSGDAVRLTGGGSLLIVDSGAMFQGEVYAQTGGATNTIELESSAGAGTLSGFGSEYVGFQGITIDSGAAWTIAGPQAAFPGVSITGFNTHDTLDLTDLTYTGGYTANWSADVLTIEDASSSPIDTINLIGNFTGDVFKLASDGGNGTNITESPACYCRGTRILTDRGEVAVEELAIGDRLATLSGEMKPIKWIGRRSYAGWLAAGNPNVQPILFKAGSLGGGLPARDLMVSPEHAMYLDGALIPARHLVDGVSIVKMKSLDEIHYFHLELQRHDVIFAEGAASETYLDEYNRGMFHNASEFRALYPGARPARFPEYRAPRIEDALELRDFLALRESRSDRFAAEAERNAA